MTYSLFLVDGHVEYPTWAEILTDEFASTPDPMSTREEFGYGYGLAEFGRYIRERYGVEVTVKSGDPTMDDSPYEMWEFGSEEDLTMLILKVMR
jgi:hypothetical protein